MNYGFETRCIHGNGTDEKTHSYGSVAVPIYQAATFAHPGIGQSTGYDYTRESNPTRTELEHTMSAAGRCGRYCSMRKRYGCGRSLSGVI